MLQLLSAMWNMCCRGLGSHSQQEGPRAGLWTDISVWHFPDDQTCLFPINTHNNTHKQAILKARTYRLSLSLCCKQSFPFFYIWLESSGTPRTYLGSPKSPKTAITGTSFVKCLRHCPLDPSKAATFFTPSWGWMLGAHRTWESLLTFLKLKGQTHELGLCCRFKQIRKGLK